MSVAYSDFFSSGLRNASEASSNQSGRLHPPRMSLDISMATGFPSQLSGSQMSSPIMDSPLLRSPVPEEMETDGTPTAAVNAYGQQRPLRRRRSSISLSVGAQGNMTSVKSPTRAVGVAYNVSRSRSGSTASIQDPKSENFYAGRARSGSTGLALKSHKRRSVKAGLAPPLPPPKSPLPELPSIAASLAALAPPRTAPPNVTSFDIPARLPLAKRVSPSQAPMSPILIPSDDGLMKSPVRDAFDLGRTRDEDIAMKEN